MRYDPPAFAQIVIDRRGPSALSPHPTGAAWQGILVAAPTTAFFRAGSPLVVPIAVTIQLEVPPRATRERVSATVTDESTGHSQHEPIEPIVDNESEPSGQDDVPSRPPRRPPGRGPREPSRRRDSSYNGGGSAWRPRHWLSKLTTRPVASRS